MPNNKPNEISENRRSESVCLSSHNITKHLGSRMKIQFLPI